MLDINFSETKETIKKLNVISYEGIITKVVGVTLEAKAQMEKQKSLNQMVLQEKAIDKWDGKLPQYYSGGELPFIFSK